MPEQEKNKSSGMKAIMQEQKKQKGASMLEQGKPTKGARVVFASDADRNLDGVRFRLGDMVWAKVKSHPWWPGQLYDPKLASASAMELKRESCFLVAFFGDSTFGWFAEAELKPFAPNFAKMSKQANYANFVDAVEDALDEVQRRVKAGLTCGCCISESTSGEEREPAGLLYDRQLRDIRSTFKPATLLTFMKDLACSPFSSSEDMLATTIARSQASAFRLLAKKASEHGGTQVLGDLILSNQIKAQVSNDVRVPERSKDKYIAEKGITKKHVSSVQSFSQEHKDLNRIKNTNEKLGGLDKVGKGKQHSMSSSPKNEKRKGSHGGTSLKNKGPKPAENVVRDSGTMDATVSHEILTSADGFKERDIGGSGPNAELPESYDPSAVSDEDIQNAPSLVVRGSLALHQEKKATKTKPKKNLGGPTNDKIVTVSKVDAIESQAFPKKPMAVAMKVKSANVDVGQFSMTKAAKKAKTVNVEVDQVAKSVKVASVDVDRVSKAKRMAEHDATEDIDASSVKVKKRKVSAKSVCNDESDARLKEVAGASDYLLQERAEEVMSDQIGLESDIRQPHVEPLVAMEATEDVSATPTLELDSEVNRLQQEEALQETPEDNHTLAPLVAGPQLQGDQLEADHEPVPGLQGKNYVDVSRKRMIKPKDSNTVETLKPEGDGALSPLVTGAELLKQGEQLEAAASSIQVKNTADIVTTKKKKPKDKFSVQPSRPDGDDALVSLVERLPKGDQLGAECRAESSLQAKNSTDISKKKKKPKDSNTVEPLNSEGNTVCSAIGDGKENAKSMETCSKVMEDQTFKDQDPSPPEVDSRLRDPGDIGGSSHVSCGALEGLQDISQKKKEISAVKYGQGEKKTIKSVKEVKESKGLPPPNKVIVSKKRVLEEKEHLRARSKKAKTVIMESAPECGEGIQGEDGAEQHEDPTKKRKGSPQSRDFREGLLSVAAKPLDSIKEEFYSAVHTAFINFRKAVYQGPEDSLASVGDVDVAVPEASNRTGLVESAREQTEVSSERGGHSFEADGSKAEDVGTKKEGEQVLGGGKQSGEGNINTPTPSKLLKKSVSFSKKVSSSSISLRPAIDVTIPVRGSKEILNRFGQRVPRLSDEAEKLGTHPSRSKNTPAERALMISFPQGFPLPSELELAEVFAKFGDLNLALSRIDSRSGCARIIYRRTQDAEAALSSMKEHPVYENARFWLKPRDADVGDLSKQSSKYNSSAERPALSCSNKLEAKHASGIRTAVDKRVPVSTENDIASDRHIQIEDESSMPQNSSSRKAGASGKGVYVSLQSNCGGMNVQPSLSASASEKAPIGNSIGSNAGASGKGAYVSLQSACGGMNAQPSLSTSASEKASIGNSVGSNAGASGKGVYVSLQSTCGGMNPQPSLSASASEKSREGTATIGHSNAAASSSTLPSIGPRSLDIATVGRSNAAASSSSLPSVRPRSLDTPAYVDISEPFLALLHECHDVVKSMGFTF